MVSKYSSVKEKSQSASSNFCFQLIKPWLFSVALYRCDLFDYLFNTFNECTLKVRDYVSWVIQDEQDVVSTLLPFWETQKGKRKNYNLK